MTFISKVAGIASVAASIADVHKTAVIYSNRAYNQASANAVISSSLGAQKADEISFRDAERKNWVNRNQFTAGIKETCARVTGYIKGFAQGSVRYLPNFALGAAAIFSKHKAVASVSAVGLALVEGYNFIKNSTGIFQRTDYLE